MDYEKAYKASLKTAAQWIKDGCTDKEKICLECVFPELRESESEDERIRKWLLECVENLSDVNFIEVSRQDVLFYLEKQKEQKPAGWQKEQMLKDAVEGRIGVAGLHNSIFIKEPEWVESLDRYNAGDKVRIIILKEEEK